MDRNLKNHIFFNHSLKSLSARRAWIEIRRGDDAGQARGVVALRKESVDRNHLTSPNSQRIYVALRKESVDRNLGVYAAVVGLTVIVALRKESVDRNDTVCANNYKRRVALRKESVDRNIFA